MHWVIFGNAIVWWAFTAVGVGLAWPELREARGALAVIILTMAVAPLCASWFAAEGVNLVTPRRALDHRIRSRVFAIGVGVAGGLLGAFLATAGLIASQEAMPDVVIALAAAAVGTGLVLAALPRLRAGACVHCGYDLAAATPAGGGRCPECGRTG